MQFRQIEAFRFVMITGTITGAAEIMAVSQPAVSRLIGDLEAALGFRLFDRVRGRLLPTEAAGRFFQGVEKFHVGLDQLDRIAEQIRTDKPADLKVCATPALSTHFFPPAVRQFQTLYPSVDLVIDSFSSSEIVNRLRSHLTHLAVTLAFPETPGVVQEPLVTTSHVCAVHESHPLAKKEVVTPQDFRGERVLRILPSGLTNWNLVAKALTDAGVDYAQSIGIQTSHTGYSLIAENLAIGLIEPFAASAWRNNGVVVRPFHPEVTFDYVIAYSVIQQRTEPLKAFAKIIRDIASA
ncbi:MULTISPECIES: LysR family transcriptional regulator [Sulfitobacter]|jgi:DNA-binding transcriptional LysR family regulator|uniref:LysR family transcriptional regulator n=1 Tax=Sulfitobacter profundi TaxID=2679961 RepID=A0ABW1Z474_9RHOB|nr:LysR substrate-binding domain-containing protein [Sulfitobacter indolifex]HCQ58635.1 LysR family transcriptional regulator [Sulfitobacter sp.]